MRVRLKKFISNGTKHVFTNVVHNPKINSNVNLYLTRNDRIYTVHTRVFTSNVNKHVFFI